MIKRGLVEVGQLPVNFSLRMKKKLDFFPAFFLGGHFFWDGGELLEVEDLRVNFSLRVKKKLDLFFLVSNLVLRH